MNFLSMHFLKKNNWEDFIKTECSYIVDKLNDLISNKQEDENIKRKPDILGSKYLYEHLIINKLKKYYQNSNANISKPNLAKTLYFKNKRYQ